MAFPQTGFELTGTWTPLANEGAFLAAVAAEAPGMVTVTQVGTSTVDGFPLRKVVIGGAGIDAPVIMVTGGIHGSEPAGREAALTFIRDLAASTDPVWVQARETFTFVVMPTCNPTGLDRGTKDCWLTDTTPLDIQGDLTRMRMNEPTVINEAFTDHLPVFLLDCHEHSTNGSMSTAMFRCSNPWTRDVSRDAFQAIADRWVADGITWGPYLEDPPGNAHRTNGIIAELRHAGSLLIETFIYHTPAVRIDAYAKAFDALVGWWVGNAEAVVSASGRSRMESRLAVRTRKGSVQVGADVWLPTWPIGYFGLTELPAQFAVFGITGSADWVPLDQPEGYLAARLLDPASFAPLAAATAHNPPGRTVPPPGTITGGTVDGRPIVEAWLDGSRVI